jgi:hypothetical protein
MEPVALPQSIADYVFGGLVAILMWVVRGYATDVKHIKANYMTREEIMNAVAASQEGTAKLFASHQAATLQSFQALQASVDSRHHENTANFRELRTRLDQLNDTLLRVVVTK